LNLLLFLAACQPGSSTPTIEAPRVAAKLLATVYISPTPGEVERQATLRAVTPTPSVPPPTPVPSATPYVGVFLGEVELDSGAVNPALLGLDITPVRPTQQVITCEILPNEVFGTTWLQSARTVNALGCPIQIMFGFSGNVQVFERGVMYWRSDSGEIWAIAPGGTSDGQYWYVAEPQEASTSGIIAPVGLRVPERGFGSVWLTVEGVRDALGFAQTDERRTQIAVQLFDSGSLFLDSESGTVFALLVDGTVFGPF
jgi:hypothetical protein